MKKIKILLLLIFVVTICFAQKSNEQEVKIVGEDGYLENLENYKDGVTKKEMKKLYEMANIYGENGNFKQASRMFKRLIKISPNNYNYHYKLGYIYLNTLFFEDRDKALKHLKKASEKIDDVYWDKYDWDKAHMDVFFHLGELYQLNNKFDEAIKYFKKFKKVSGRSYSGYKISADRKIKQCKLAKEMIANPKEGIGSYNLNIESVENERSSKLLNSTYTEHSPIYIEKNKTLYFTSKRKGIYPNKTNKDGQYFEDIYKSEKIDGLWQSVKLLSEPPNSKKHDAIVSFADNGDKMIIYNDSKGRGDLFTSVKKDGVWGRIKKKEFRGINKLFQNENSACFSKDNKTVYFTSNRDSKDKDNFDIFTAKRDSIGARWKEIEKIEIVNTDLNEQSPYIQGDRLYFSSNGHGSMGGIDIFYSDKNSKGNWSKPKNMGSPVNTSGNDLFYTPTEGQYAFYTSNNAGVEGNKLGTVGSYDIYMVGPKFVYELSCIVNSNEGKPISDAKLTVKNNKDGKKITLNSQNENKYHFNLNAGDNYSVFCEKEGYLPYSLDIETIIKLANQEKTEYLELVAMKIEETGFTDSLVVENVLFGFDKHKTKECYNNLDKLSNFLIIDTSVVISLDGHTDFNGPARYNKKLSERRAVFVKKYLLKKEVKEESLIIKSFGEDRPIAKQKNSNGTINWDGCKFNRRVEFNVVKQSEGKVKLVIKPLEVPEDLKLD